MNFPKQRALLLKKGSIGYAYALSGDESKAREILKELLNSNHPDYITAWQIALIYTGLKEIDNAFQWLNRACEVHSPLMVWIKCTPEFVPLHNDSRWSQLLQRLNL